MSFAEIAVKRPVFIACVFAATLILGALARSRLPSSLYPDVSFPIMNVVIPYPGAGPHEIEEQVVRPTETALSSLSGIRLVRSLSLDSAAVVTAVFTMDTDIRFAEQRVIQAMSRVRPQLPSGILEPSIKSVDPTETPVMTISLAAHQPAAEMYDLADREVRAQLEQIPQVAEVDIVGAGRKQIDVALNLATLKALQMSASEVVGRLQAAGVDVPAGQIIEKDRETLVRTIGHFDSLEAIRHAPLRVMGPRTVTVGDVATVSAGLSPEKNRVSIDGRKGVLLRVFRRSGANAVEASTALASRIDEINAHLAPTIDGFHLDILRDGARPVRDGIRDATEAILWGLFLTVAVVFFFLGNVRSTVITGLALPNSILGAFFLMAIAGFTINITTLAALALAVGLLIDDAIVVRENIFRRMQLGEKPHEAAVLGTREVTLAVVATTLTVLSVFAPVSFLQGIIGQFFKQFGLTICFAMLISLFDSLTIAPMLSTYFGRTESHGIVRAIVRPFERLQNGLQKIYLATLERSLRRPLTTLVLALVVCAVSGVLLKFIPKNFVPSQETGEFRVSIETAPGTTLAATDRILLAGAQKIRSHHEVARTIVTTGGAYGEHNQGEILVLLKPPEARTLRTSAVKELVRHDLESLAGATTTRVEDLLDIGGSAGHPYTLKITGDNIAELSAVATKLIEKLKASTDLKDFSRSDSGGENEIRWVVNSAEARQAGLSSGEVGNELRILLSGVEAAQLREAGGETPVRVSAATFNPSQVNVPTMSHQLVPLLNVASRQASPSPSSISREDRKAFVEVTAELEASSGGLEKALEQTRKLFSSGEITLPPGVAYEFSGQTKDFQDLLSKVILAALLSILAMYLVLASLYDSFFVPFSIMLVLPLAICGAFYSLWLTRSVLDIYSMVGCILLLGVAAKNSILLVDYVQSGLREGLSLATALRRAGEVRFRPIMMTSFALIAGMLPLALALHESARGQAPMAIAVIGGVISSTLLSLVVVPAAYGYIFRFERAVLRLVGRGG